MQSVKNVESEDEDEMLPPPEENSGWSVYLKPYWISVLMNKHYWKYSALITFWYLVQFIGCVACVNLYSDNERLIPCALTGTLADPDEASKVFDFALMFLSIFHMIEWLRACLLLTVICIGVNWTIGWYLTIPNTIFGLVAYAVTMMVYFSDDGKLCKEVQEPRAQWLLVEIICFWVLFFCFAFPMLLTVIMGKGNADTTLKKAYEDAQDSEEDGGD